MCVVKTCSLFCSFCNLYFPIQQYLVPKSSNDNAVDDDNDEVGGDEDAEQAEVHRPVHHVRDEFSGGSSILSERGIPQGRPESQIWMNFRKTSKGPLNPRFGKLCCAIFARY